MALTTTIPSDEISRRYDRNRQKDVKVVSAGTDVSSRFREIWASRELVFYLTRTAIQTRYKNSFLGLVWSMLQQAITLAVYWVVFSKIVPNGIPQFVIFLFSGLLLFAFFSASVLTATGAIVANAGIVKKVSFPREILALAAVGSSGFFFLLQALVMFAFMAILHNPPAWDALWLVPVALIPLVFLASALGILLGSVNVYLRDTQYLATVIIGSVWMWACPIVYSFQSLSTHFKSDGLAWLYLLNPMTPLVMTFQRIFYNKTGMIALTNKVAAGMPIPKARILPPWPLTTYLWMDCLVFVFASALLWVAMVVFGRLSGNFAEEL